VVFGGGGVAGIAWEIGVLMGLEERAPHAFTQIRDAATTYIGTSAGSAVAAQLASGVPLSRLYEALLEAETAEISVEVDFAAYAATWGRIRAEAQSPDDERRRIGAMAEQTDSAVAPARAAAIAARLPVPHWPAQRMLITAVDVQTGEPRVFDRASKVALVDAVAASCAVPGVWPVVEIAGRRYMDGGARTIANVDLAAGCDPVLIIVPGAEVGPLGEAVPGHERAALGSARVMSIFADDASIAAFGTNPLDPSARPAAARAGRDVGVRLAAEVDEFWR